MNQIPRPLSFWKPARVSPGAHAPSGPVTIAAADRELGEVLGALSGEFPQLRPVAYGAAALRDRKAADLLLLRASTRAAADLAGLITQIAQTAQGRAIVVLEAADLPATRRLLEAGAADVLPAPLNETALALSLGRLLRAPAAAPGPRAAGQVVAMLKAGGGVGASALAAQSAIKLAEQGRSVCLVDLDLQSGTLGVYLDQADALGIAEVLGSDAPIEETPFTTALAQHKSGARLLAAPRDLTPMEAISTVQVGALIGALQRNFELTILDLPPVWTAWTSHALQLSSRIVLVTQLSVPHIGLLNRQLRALSLQGLEQRPLTLVCNAVSAEQRAGLSVKTAEQALGRSFDLIIPSEPATMTAALNRGAPVGAIKRAGRLDKAIEALAGALQAQPAMSREW